MKAIGFYSPLPIEPANALVDLELPMPDVGPHDLLVKVVAISVNPVDVKVRTNTVPPSGSVRILGYDVSGIVQKIGGEVSLFRVGDEVFYAGAIGRQGANAEYHAVDERIVGRKPSSLSFSEAAALPLTTLAAWELLFDRLRVPPANTTSQNAILIVGGAGGVGSILIQIARQLTDLVVVATASRPESIAWCINMGAHYTIDHRAPLQNGLREVGIQEVRYVAGLTGTEKHLASIVESMAPHGALAIIDDPPTLDVVPLKRKSLAIHWEGMFTRSTFNTPDLIEQHRILNDVSALVDRGLLRTTMTEDFGTINATNLRRAHSKLQTGTSIGKIVLSGF